MLWGMFIWEPRETVLGLVSFGLGICFAWSVVTLLRLRYLLYVSFFTFTYLALLVSFHSGVLCCIYCVNMVCKWGAILFPQLGNSAFSFWFPKGAISTYIIGFLDAVFLPHNLEFCQLVFYANLEQLRAFLHCFLQSKFRAVFAKKKKGKEKEKNCSVCQLMFPSFFCIRFSWY